MVEESQGQVEGVDCRWVSPPSPSSALARIVSLIKDLGSDGQRYTILLFVNIYMADDKHFDWPEIQRARIPLILEQLGVEGVHIFIATRRDEYWKPSVGVWEEWLEKWNEGVMPGESESR